MFTAALVLSVATNVGLIFYIVAEQALNKWEKKNASSSALRRTLHQRAAMVHCPPSQQE